MSWSASAFPMKPLGELARIQAGYAFESARFTESPTDVPLVKGENVQQGYVDWSIAKRWPEAEMDALEQFLLKPGDIVVAMDRPWVEAGLKWAYIKPEDPPSLLVQRVARLRAGRELDQTYLRAVISSSYFSAYIQPIVTGVNVPHISGKQIAGFKVPVPPLAQQSKVAALISAYDDLIANNQRRITLLESMTEEIYREWFVRMRFPNYETTAFSKGIPNGWDVVPFGQHCRVVKGKSYASEDLVDDTAAMPFVTLKSFNRGGGYRAGGLKHYKGEFKTQQLVKQGDIVMAVTDMTQDRVVVGQAALVPDLGERGAVISLDVIKLEPVNVDPTYLYLFLRFSGFANHIKEFANGANVLHLKPDLVTAQKVLLAPRALQDRVALIAKPMLQQAEQLAESCRMLSEMRDALLPRLISGKLRIDALDIQFPPSMQQLPRRGGAIDSTI